jgi:hypothetical protein
MTSGDDFLHELEASLHVRGRPRRRLLVECRDHLAESGDAYGPEEAVRRFGSAADLARAFDLEVATGRSLRATAASVIGVVGVGISALVMVNAVDPRLSAPVAWAIIFFGCAQVSAISLVLAVVRAAVLRGDPGTPADVALLSRRNGVALAFAFLTLFAVGAALPGRSSAWLVLAGPVLAAGAAVSVMRSWSLAKKLDQHRVGVVRPPLADFAAVVRRLVEVPAPVRRVSPVATLVVAVGLAMCAAFTWDRFDHGTVAASAMAAGIEAALVIAGFAALGRPLGLRAAGSRRWRGRAL